MLNKDAYAQFFVSPLMKCRAYLVCDQMLVEQLPYLLRCR